MKKLIIITLLSIVIFLTLYFRVVLPDKWLHGETLRLPTVDAYYQARFAQLIQTHGTELPTKDPYFMSSGTYGISDVILWPTIIATLANLSPNNGIDTVCFYLPPILAVLCVIGVFAIVAILFNAWAGLFSALLLATMGGEFMARSIAGSADYHAFESFCLVFFVLCIVSAIKYHNNIINWLSSIFAGLFMASYFTAWSGAIYLYIIFVAAYVLYLIILAVKKEAPSGSILQVPCVVIPSTILFYIIISNLTGSRVDNNILIISAVFFVVCLITTLIQIFFVNRANRWGFIVVTSIFGIVAMFALYNFASVYYQYVNGIISSIVNWNAISHTSEERPILIFGNEFSLQALWGNFTASIFLCLIGIGILIKKSLKADRHDLFNYLFITIGALVMIMSTLAMVRFAYYLAIYTAILAGLVIYLIIEVSVGYLKRNTKKMKWFDKAGDIMLVTVMLVFILVPNFMISKQFSNPLEGSLTGGWEQAMIWLKNNSPEPFKDKDYYTANYVNNIQEPSYSVLSWWDYGYWITYIAHRVPTCNPGSTNRDIPAVFLTTTNIDNAIKVLQSAKSRYIVIDYQTATGKFQAMPTYAEKATGELKKLWSWDTPGYISIFTMGEGDKIQRMTVFHPDYYKSMAVRLFNFDGQAVKSPGCPVIIYKDIDGQKWVQKIIDTPSYREALDYTSKNPLTDGSLYTYGGTDPFLSCVDLEQVKDIIPLKGFGGVDLSGMSQAVKQAYEIKIFEYKGGF
jgi:asparagine N-glycosylation enzyme membrane subunit Stt3